MYGGNVTLRYKSTLYHLGVGRRHNGKAVLILVANRDIRILTPDGTLIRQLTLDPKRISPKGGDIESTGVHDVPRHHRVSEGRTTPRVHQHFYGAGCCSRQPRPAYPPAVSR